MKVDDNMKHVKRIIIYLLCVLLFVDKLYALSFVKVDEDNNEITDAVFDFKTSNGKVLETIYLEQQSSVPSTKESLNSSISTT